MHEMVCTIFTFYPGGAVSTLPRQCTSGNIQSCNPSLAVELHNISPQMLICVDPTMIKVKLS